MSSMNAPPAWMHDPEVLGNWLAVRLKFAKNTAERMMQVSRVDAICWYLTLPQVGCLATRDCIKKFATAFRTEDGVVLCSSLLNACYGGVSQSFDGSLGNWRHGNYGRLAPLYRPFKAQYSPTIDGVRRGARVQSLLNGSVAS